MNVIASTRPIEGRGELDWQSLVLLVHPSHQEIANCVYFHGMQDGWQDLRVHLKGKSMEYRFKALVNRLENFKHTRVVQVQVSNYVLALKRGGMWK